MGNTVSGTPTIPPRGPSNSSGNSSIHHPPRENSSEKKEAPGPSPGSPETTETLELWGEVDSAPPAPASPNAPLETPEQNFQSVTETSETPPDLIDLKDVSPTAQKTIQASTYGEVEGVEPGVIPEPPPPPEGGEDAEWMEVLSKKGDVPSQNKFLWDLLIENPKKDEVYAKRSAVRKVERELKVKMHKILFLILMGNVEKAVRELLVESERFNRLFNRMLVKNLNRARDGKMKILLALGRKRPPKAHDNTGNEAGARDDQNKSMQYNQWVSVTAQLLSTVEQSEREIMDLIQESRQHMNRMWEAYQGLKEAETRSARTVYQSFKA